MGHVHHLKIVAWTCSIHEEPFERLVLSVVVKRRKDRTQIWRVLLKIPKEIEFKNDDLGIISRQKIETQLNADQNKPEFSLVRKY